jgi:hypothetical protein
MPHPIAPEKIRFIKLGKNGEWEDSCISDNTIRLGYQSPHHNECVNGNWDSVQQYWLNLRKGNAGVATRDLNQIRDFYDLSETDVWITFFNRKLYWCRTFRKIIERPDDKSRVRQVIGSWSSSDINGKALTVENIDGRVTKVQAFRGTICSIDLQPYLVRKINGQTIFEVEKARISLTSLKVDIEDLIKGLWWHDFELLIDLVFMRSGWQRFSVLGKTEKNLDLDIYSPTSQKRAFVQVKSTTTSVEIQAYIDTYKSHGQFQEMYFVYHSCPDELSDLQMLHTNVHLWGLKRIAELVVDTGLSEWLVNKRS